MKKVKVINETQNEVIFEKGLLANNFFDRFRGLMARKRINDNEALCIVPCKGVHTFFMKFSIDVIHIDRNDNICYIEKNLKPWKMGKIVKTTSYVIEMKAGRAERLNLKVKDKIILENFNRENI